MSKKRNDLIEHAERLFYENGFHAVGLKRVLKEANVSLMTMYNHFDSKEALILETLKKRENRYFSLLRETAAENKESCALSLAEAHFKWIRSYRKGCMFLRAKEEFPSAENEINKYAVAHKKLLISFFEEHHFNYPEATRLAILFEGATALSEVLDLEAVYSELMFTIQNLFEK
ncbi:TetR family transcriptional regulator [Virgibacillus sp. 7505]|uniref:TetR/AcrR family transcriptional regulator n=1 Tax=Virgibacillus sp. 7505 TaxID=2022548 RepID=UPI000BA54FF5|nr:TetR/AcrR family transcriptional regulator [Virgibacillus sp. 7505]PAE16750.1 TetR family transcriptional regulator [Virgibacillus sp. 7505]